MNRRELLKFSLLSPLLGLFKKKPKEKTSELTLDKLLKCKDELEKNSLKPDENGMIDISRTAGTSSEGEVIWLGYTRLDDTSTFHLPYRVICHHISIVDNDVHFYGYKV